MKKFFYLYICLVFSCFLWAQQSNTDSLKLTLKNAKHDTTRCNILNELIEEESDDKVWPEYNEQLKNIAKSNLERGSRSGLNAIFKRHLSNALNNEAYLAD